MLQCTKFAPQHFPILLPNSASPFCERATAEHQSWQVNRKEEKKSTSANDIPIPQEDPKCVVQHCKKQHNLARFQTGFQWSDLQRAAWDSGSQARKKSWEHGTGPGLECPDGPHLQPPPPPRPGAPFKLRAGAQRVKLWPFSFLVDHFTIEKLDGKTSNRLHSSSSNLWYYISGIGLGFSSDICRVRLLRGTERHTDPKSECLHHTEHPSTTDDLTPWFHEV